MRLLDLVTGEFVEFSGPPAAPPYAIISHRWDAVEQTYQDIREIQRLCERNRRSSAAPRLPSSSSHNDSLGTASPPSPAHPQSIWDSDSRLSEKIRGACKAARRDGIRHLWIDSCCIDKTSSSELSESINSMFAWYRDAEVCYTFLADVPTAPSSLHKWKGSAFRSSMWFTRGWTLQELIAPRQLVFLSQTWELLGTKATLSGLVEEITGVPAAVLNDNGRLSHKSLDTCSVAQRMSWAANHRATKVEDEAYSLLGIFDIQMSPLDGEGKRAFRRLQEEILRRIPDQSIFAWGKIYSKCLSPLTVEQPVTANPNSIKNVSRPPPTQTASAGALESSLNVLHRRPLNLHAAGSYTMFADSPKDFAGAGQIVTIPLIISMFRSSRNIPL